MDRHEKMKTLWNRYKYPLIVLAAGIVLMTVPTTDRKDGDAAELPFREILCRTEGVGRAEVLVSEKGVVVVCDGADRAAVRLDILRCVKSYTGFTSEKVTILKMKKQQ